MRTSIRSSFFGLTVTEVAHSFQRRLYYSSRQMRTRVNLRGVDLAVSTTTTTTARRFCTSSPAVERESDGVPRACSLQSQYRCNELNVQMLSHSLHRQIFGGSAMRHVSEGLLRDVKEHLCKFNLWGKETARLPDVELKLPQMFGASIDEHFRHLALQQTATYRANANLLAISPLPLKPKEWVYRVGWTRYNPDGTCSSVDFPEEEGLIFDIETLVPEGHCPTMATAASTKAWYSWCSQRLIEKRFFWSPNLWTEDLIPLETATGSTQPVNGVWKQRLIVGHNVGFDRSFIKEQYYPKGPRTRFLDTMSLHIANNGLTTFQRMLFMAKKKGSHRKEVQEVMNHSFFEENPLDLDWIDKSSLNNLHDVHQLYTKEAPLKKETRNVFVTGSMEDIRQDFQNLMTYCSGDVEATHAVFQKLWPEFQERFPHPVTLGGMLEMGTAYLPVNQNWRRYTALAHAIFTSLHHELKITLMVLADSACQLMHNKRYKDDVWLYDLDWSTKDVRMKKIKATKMKEFEQGATATERIERLMDYTHQLLPSRPVHLPGYPRWYSELCPKDVEWGDDMLPGPSHISTQRRVTPKLLRLTWQGYPLVYDKKMGWGYVVPGRPLVEDGNTELEAVLAEQDEAADDGPAEFPLRSLYRICQPALEWEVKKMEVTEEFRQQVLEQLEKQNFEESDTADLWRELAASSDWKPKKRKRSTQKADSGPWFHDGDGPYSEVDIPGCWFFKLPHKDGPGNNTGNPLSKDHLASIESGDLRANCDTNVDKVLKQHVMCSYWKNNEQRIRGQMVVKLHKAELPDSILQDPSYQDEAYLGAILPRVVTAGTVTRRSVEPTWLTASNARANRVGSELKAMIQCPPGYKFVGADVDSQELWISAILGDANFAKIHGSTAFGWMTLLGNKADSTDLHSRIAEQVGITRDQAKIFNYGRIYGAGKRFAERLLLQFNTKMSPAEAKSRAETLYTYCKGKRKQQRIDPPGTEDNAEAKPRVTYGWVDGTESHMFNKLESIAMSEDPRTPVLECKISKSLEPRNVDSHFMTSRVNWVVQSSAVDYLHLMLVSMRWLLDTYDIDGRFAISIHDEVRYLVVNDDTDRAALALQITNLLVRSMFAFKVGMYDLPQAVAFFSSVDIDTCMRKEVTMDCKTPSNPEGLCKGYNVPFGESLTIYETLKRTGGSLEAPPKNHSHQKDEFGAT